MAALTEIREEVIEDKVEDKVQMISRRLEIASTQTKSACADWENK